MPPPVLPAMTKTPPSDLSLAIIDLRERPDLFDKAVDWHHGKWAAEARRTRGEIEGFYRESLDTRPIPATLLALAAGVPAGMASLRAFDPFYPAFKHCTPWLDSLFVDPAFRGRGIGTSLSEAVAALALRLGHREIYLGTPDQQKLYARMGWTWLADDPGLGHEMSSIMVRRLSG